MLPLNENCSQLINPRVIAVGLSTLTNKHSQLGLTPAIEPGMNDYIRMLILG